MEVVIASTKSVPPGGMIPINLNGQSILLANVNDKYYAIGNVCTHMGCFLTNGYLKDNRVQCFCHDSIFDVTTGAVVQGPATETEPSFKLVVKGDDIFADI
jgi:nitrite reductase/ring-hydroxylating ferredoxin subunit